MMSGDISKENLERRDERAIDRPTFAEKQNVISEAEQNQEHEAAKARNPQVFKSFSEGMSAVSPLVLEDSSTGEVHYDAARNRKNSEIAYRQLQVDRTSIENLPEGEKSKPVPLSDFISKETHFGRAHQGKKSPTLNSLVDQAISRPWQIQAVVGENLPFSDYNPGDNTIYLDSKLSKSKQLDTFGHETWHSCNQFLDRLFGKLLTQSQYRDLKLEQEAGAFLAEYKINKELGHSQPVTFEFVSRGKLESVKIGDYIKTTDGKIDDDRSVRAIAELLRTSPFPLRDREGELQFDDSGQIVTDTYSDKNDRDYLNRYLPNFEQNRKMLTEKGWLGKGY